VTVLVAVEEDSLLGFCSLLPSRDDDAFPSTAEIAAIYVDPARWRSGIGASLIRAAFAAARTRDFHEITLWVLSANSAACAFYQSFGFTPDGQTKIDTRLGFPLDQLRYRLVVPGAT
jgi:L-amino acid N-acyltransferase YncA